MLKAFSGLSVHGHLERQALGEAREEYYQESRPLVSKARLIVSPGR